MLAVITYFVQWLQRLLLPRQRKENDPIKIKRECNVVVQKSSHTCRSREKEYESTFQIMKKPVTCMQYATGSGSFLSSFSNNTYRKRNIRIGAALSLLRHSVQHLSLNLRDAKRQCSANANLLFSGTS